MKKLALSLLAIVFFAVMALPAMASGSIQIVDTNHIWPENGIVTFLAHEDGNYDFQTNWWWTQDGQNHEDYRGNIHLNAGQTYQMQIDTAVCGKLQVDGRKSGGAWDQWDVGFVFESENNPACQPKPTPTASPTPDGTEEPTPSVTPSPTVTPTIVVPPSTPAPQNYTFECTLANVWNVPVGSYDQFGYPLIYVKSEEPTIVHFGPINNRADWTNGQVIEFHYGDKIAHFTLHITYGNGGWTGISCETEDKPVITAAMIATPQPKVDCDHVMDGAVTCDQEIKAVVLAYCVGNPDPAITISGVSFEQVVRGVVVVNGNKVANIEFWSGKDVVNGKWFYENIAMGDKVQLQIRLVGLNLNYDVPVVFGHECGNPALPAMIGPNGGLFVYPGQGPDEVAKQLNLGEEAALELWEKAHLNTQQGIETPLS